MSAILGVSFGSLATVFTKDAEVLGIVRTGVLVCSTLTMDDLFDFCIALQVYTNVGALAYFL